MATYSFKKANPQMYRSNPVFANSANQLMGYARNLFSQQAGRRPAFQGFSNVGGPDPYAGLIGGMPDLSALQSQFGAMDADSAAARDAAIRRYIVSYGAPPDFSNMAISDQAKGFLKGALDAKTLELAQNAEKEGVSVHARQAHDDAIARRRIPAQLAGRGMLRSGQTGYDLGEQGQAYKNLQYDTLNELLNSIEGTVGSYLQGKRERELALAQAQMQAAWAAQQAWGGSQIGAPPPQYDVVTGRTAPPPPASSSSFYPGYFGNKKQTQTALANRLRAGRM